MPVTTAEIQFRLSGGASNTDVNASLGGAISSTQIVSASMANLFENVGAAEALAGSVTYRGIYIINTDPSLTWQAVRMWISQISASTDTAYAIGISDEGVGATMATIANETTAPTNVTFSSPTTMGAGLNIGNVPATDEVGIWIRKTVDANASALNNDNAIFRAQGETAE